MGFLSKAFKALKKVSNFLGLGIPNFVNKQLKKWLTPDLGDKEGLKIQRTGSDFAIPVVYGTRIVGAIVVDRAISNDAGGLENENYHALCVFCYGEIDDFVEFYFNGISWNDARWTKDDTRFFNYELVKGSLTQNPLTKGTVFERWDTSLSHYSGLAIAMFTFKQDKDSTIWNGEPQITAKIRGKKCVDPRNPTAPATYTENPAVHEYDYIKSSVYGLGLTDAEIDLQSFIDVANICDTEEISTVERKICETVDGVYTCYILPPEIISFKRFTNNNIIDTGRTLFDNVAEIANAFRGFFPDSDGRIKIAAEIEGDSVFSFNADNIVSSITSAQPGLKDRFNRVVVRFPNVANKYEMDECFYPALDDPLYTQWLAEDNGLNLEKTITAEYTVYKAEALQLAEVAAKASRNAEVVQFTAEAEAIQCDVGDIIDISEENRGWIGKPFRIGSIEYREDFLVNISAIQHNDAIYPWSDLDYSEIIGGTNLGDPANIPAPTGLSISPDETGATSGRLSWDYEANAFVRRFLVSIDVLQTNYTLTADIPAGSSVVYVSPTPSGEFTGDSLYIGEQEYTIQSTQIGQFTLQSPTTEAYTTGQLAKTNYPSELFKSEVAGQFYEIPLLAPNGYTANVKAVSTIGATSPNAAISFDLVTPVPPTSLDIEPSNFELTVIPVLAGSGGLGITFEFALGDTTKILGRGSSIVIVGLSHNTNYTVFCRTRNYLGVSAWMSQIATTTADPTDLIDLIGEGIADQIFDDVVAEVEADLGVIVDAALIDYSTTIEVNQLISDRIDEVNEFIGEDPRIAIVEIMNNALGNFETGEDLKTETKERTTVTTQLQAQINNNTASITETNQVIADLDSAIASQLVVIQTDVNGNTASITNLQQTVSDLDSATATDILALRTDVDDNTAQITIVNQVVSDLEIATATSISDLTTTVGLNTANINSISVAVSDLDSATTASINSLTASVGANSASITNVNTALATEVSTRATQVSQLQAADTAILSSIAEVESDVAGNSTAINAVTATVNNPTTGLSATFTLANTAKTTADGAASAANSVTLQVNNPTTGLTATSLLAQSASTTANNALSSATLVSNTVNNPTTGLSATATIANGAQATADGALAATTGLKTAIAGPGNEANAQLILSTTFEPEAGFAFGRAFLGVSSTTGGVSTVTGVIADGQTNTLEFRADKLRLSDTAGIVQLYWDTSKGKWIYKGDIVASTFQTATSGYRAEMSGTGLYPFWFGAGTKNYGNAAFLVDTSGNVKVANATMFNCNIQGRLLTENSSGIRCELYDDGTYLFWAGTGEKTDVNGIFWIKRDGTGFIKGEFFSGQIIETKFGSVTSSTSSWGTPIVATAANHNSAGKVIEVSCAGSAIASVSTGGSHASVRVLAELTLKRGTTVIGTTRSSGVATYDPETGITSWDVNYQLVALDTPGVGTFNYSVEVAFSFSGTLPSVTMTRNATIKTFENKLS